MNDSSLESFEQEFNGRFAWRKQRQIQNLKELAEFPNTSGASAMDDFPGLREMGKRDFKDALKRSILYLWLEAVECYIFGDYQACILVCGATIERCLKLEYETVNGIIPSKENWTLGKIIKKCDKVVKSELLIYAREMLEPRNSRAHALLEHADPVLSIIGGKDRGIQIINPYAHVIEPYRGEAKKTIELAYKILKGLYGGK